MNKKLLIITVIIGLLDLVGTGTLKANAFCRDTSKHLSEKCDNKELHYVHYCNCDCDRYYTLQPHNQCIQCMHYHAEPMEEIIKVRPIQIKEPYMAPKMVLNPADRDIKKVLNKLAINLKRQGS